MKLEKFEEVSEFYTALSVLTCNSQSNIKNLTMLAEDSIKFAPKIVEVIEHHIQQVRPAIKLPVLYVLDSIVKNVAGYLELFNKNIVQTFCGVFTKADETTRSKLWKLRQTWKEIFPANTLYDLDVKVHSVDPAWPIVPPPAARSSIHVNPNFLLTQKQEENRPRSPTEAEMREELLQKQNELQKLQLKKLELELQAKRNLELQQKNIILMKSFASVNQAPVVESIDTKPIATIVPNKNPKDVCDPQRRKVTSVDLSVPVLSPPPSLVGESTEKLIDWLKSKSGIDKIDQLKNEQSPNNSIVVNPTTVLSASLVNNSCNQSTNNNSQSPKSDSNIIIPNGDESTRTIGNKSASKQPKASPPKVPRLNGVEHPTSSPPQVIIKDEDHRPVFPAQKSAKRKSDGSFDLDNSMRLKVNKTDNLFGNEDVDLRARSNSNSPSTTPKSRWDKFDDSERKQQGFDERDNNCLKNGDQSIRSRFNNSPPGDRRVQYNHADNRKVWENRPPVWEKNVFLGNRRTTIDHGHGGNVMIDHGRIGNPTWQQQQPPWQQQGGPWMRPMPPQVMPQYNQDYCPPGPWQGPPPPPSRGCFGPMRPDVVGQFPPSFNHNMRPRMNPNFPINGGPIHPDVNQFSHGFNSNMRPGINQNHMMRPVNGHMMPPHAGMNSMNNHFNGPTNIIYNNEPPRHHLMNDSRRISPHMSPNFEHDLQQNGNAPILKIDGVGNNKAGLVKATNHHHHHQYKSSETKNGVNSVNQNSNSMNLVKQNSGLPLTLNVNELYERLVASGIVPKTEVKVEKEPEVIPSFDKPETLKCKRPSAVSKALYSGSQCGSCGIRFSAEQGAKYQQHLDWHFRQNHGAKESAKIAKSRPWYLKRKDWIEYLEIEDVDDKKASWFEQQSKNVNGDDLSNDKNKSVPAGSPDENKCNVCQDVFEEFYNNEMEEWHVRPAVHFEGNNYHPLCLVDVKKLLARGSSMLDESMEEGEKEKTEENTEDDKTMIEVKKEIKEEVCDERVDEQETEKIEKEMTEDSSETVTEMKKEKKEDFDETIDGEGMEKSEVKEESSTEENAGDIVAAETQEEAQEVSDTTGEKVVAEADKIEDKIVDEVPGEGEDEKNNEEAMEIEIKEAVNDEKEIEPEIMECSFDKVIIKEEPIEVHDDGQEMSFNYENVVIKTEPVDPEPEPEVPVQEAGTVDTTLAAVTSSIDGNVELESAPLATLVDSPRIKINMTNSVIAMKEPQASIVYDPSPAPASLKPALQGIQLQEMPCVEGDGGQSGLCAIM